MPVVEDKAANIMGETAFSNVALILKKLIDADRKDKDIHGLFLIETVVLSVNMIWRFLQ